MEDFNQARAALIAHLQEHALRTDGPFTLRSGEVSSWYLDGRQTTFDGQGAKIVGAVVAGLLPTGTTAVGGMTMGADPIAVATAMAADPSVKAFSIRKEPKDHGTGGRLVGPVTAADSVVVLEDTTTTGSALMEAIDVLRSEGVNILEAISLVDRSDGKVLARLRDHGVEYQAVVEPADLGVL